jgi:DNA-binding IclR family transcriptional regulator
MSTAPSQSNDNRSLSRRLALLRAFKPGIDVLGKSELADRTGLPMSTVSRLTGTLVRAGFLQHDVRMGGYRLHATVLALAYAMRTGSYILQQAHDELEKAARQMSVNVGLAIADNDDMIYLDTLRFGPNALLRKVVSGQRVPTALTSLGRAYISTQQGEALHTLMGRLKARHARDWHRVRPEIDHSVSELHACGVCAVSWQPRVVAIAAPMVFENEPVHVLNMSLYTDLEIGTVKKNLIKPLLDLRERIMAAIAADDSQ